MKQKLLKQTFLVLALLGAGITNAWADVTPFSESYSSTSTTTGWSTSVANQRYVPQILNDDDNYYMSVNQSTAALNDGGRYNNGATVTGTVISGKATAGDNFTLIFDIRLGSHTDSNQNQGSTSFVITDAANSGTMFSLTDAGYNSTNWTVNGGATEYTLEGSNNSTAIGSKPWYTVKLSRSGSSTFVTITKTSDASVVLPRTIVSSSATGGLGNIVFTSSRYNANFAIDNIVVREIEDGDLPTETYYTATFTDNTSGTDVTSGTTIYTDAERTTPIANGMLVDGTTYYYTATQTAYVDYENSFTVDGADPNISFYMTAQPTYSYTVRAVDGSSNILATLASGSSYNTALVSYAYPEYINVNGTLYTKAATNKVFGNNFTLSSDNQVEDVTYSASSYTDVIYYVEAENITGMTASNSGQGDARCSNRYGAYAASDVDFITLPAGKYKIIAGFCGNSGTTFNIKAGETTVWTAATTGSRGTATGSEFTINSSTALTIAQAGSNNALLDNIIIQKVTTSNEIVGTMDYTTAYYKQWNTTPVWINAGETAYYKFVNYNNGGSILYQNWYLYGATEASDNVVVFGPNHSNTATNGTYTSKPDFTNADLNGATVELTTTLADAGDGTYTLTTTAVTTKADGTTTLSPNLVYTQTNLNVSKLKLYVSVEKSWLELLQQAVKKTVTDAEWATYYSNNALDFSDVEGLSAYAVEGASGSTLTLSDALGAVPAETPVLIQATANTYTIPVVASGTAVGTNKLEGVHVATVKDANSIYVLLNGDSGVGFYQNANAFTVGANTAYLPADFAAGARLFYNFYDDTTGLNVIDNGQLTIDNSQVYDLQGRRVNGQLKKGLYIINGKKVAIK